MQQPVHLVHAIEALKSVDLDQDAPSLPRLVKNHTYEVKVATDQRLILKMLLRPQNYGQGLHDYSCHGANWVLQEDLLPRQSPIDIDEEVKYSEAFKLDFRYRPFEALTGLENLEWTLRLKGKNMGGIKLWDLNGDGPFTYKVNHMHMHGPSEHRLGGRQHDLEIHIVHELVKSSVEGYKDTLAVVAFLFKLAPSSHPFIKKLRPHDFGHIA